MRSVGYAAQGFGFAVRTERHMKVHLGAAAAVFVLAALLDLSPLEWAVLIGVCSLVIAMELMNTAIEKAVDLTMPQRHPLAKTAKDAAAAAVLVTAIFAVVVGILILGPPLLETLTR
ncbi:diacylglycerol kinase family protein [Paenibacillus abyssi]|uniref:diacylglycerol kinase family protein n=1 Tax=Paenibacillus abyssi TaxID=1340531 RepID=UPI0027E49D1F|nr:diacylglycerol kinase family protein [Paenibacillus abyssi]